MLFHAAFEWEHINLSAANIHSHAQSVSTFYPLPMHFRTIKSSLLCSSNLLYATPQCKKPLAFLWQSDYSPTMLSPTSGAAAANTTNSSRSSPGNPCALHSLQSSVPPPATSSPPTTPTALATYATASASAAVAEAPAAVAGFASRRPTSVLHSLLPNPSSVDCSSAPYVPLFPLGIARGGRNTLFSQQRKVRQAYDYYNFQEYCKFESS